MSGIPSQLISLPFVGGEDTKEDAIITSRPTSLINVRNLKTGASERRYGFEEAGPNNVRIGGGTPPSPELLAELDDQLVRIGGGEVDTFQTFASSDWSYRGKVPDVIARAAPYATALPANIAGVYADPDIAYIAVSSVGYAVAVYVIATSTSYVIAMDVTVVSTGVRVVSQLALSSTATVKSCPRVVAIGSSVYVAWYDAGTSAVRGAVVSGTTWAVTTAATDIVAGAGYGGALDMQANNAGTALVLAASDATDFKVWPVSTGLVAGASVTVQATVAACEAVSLRVVSGERAWVAYTYTAGGSDFVKLAVLDTSLALVGSAHQITSVATVAGGIGALAVERVSALRAIVAWNYIDSDHLYWQEVTLSLPTTFANVYTPARSLNRGAMLSRIMVRSSRAYVWIYDRHDVDSAQHLVDLYAAETQPTGIHARPVARACVGQLAVTAARAVRYRGLASIAQVGATDEYITATVVDGPQVASTSQLVQGLRLSWGTTWLRGVAATPQGLVIGGGWPHVLDDGYVWEIGFANSPSVAAATIASSATAGSLNPTSAYTYRFVFVARHGRGHVHRSPPSLTKAVTISGGHGSANLTLTNMRLGLTGRSDSSTYGPTQIEVYRTIAGGTVFFYVTTLANNLGGAITYNDGLADATLQTRRQLYTTGGVLDRVAPESAAVVTSYKSAVVLGDTASGSLWTSGEMLAEEGVWFAPELTYAPIGARVTALAGLESALALWTSDDVYVLTGEPANDIGQSTLSAPQRIQTDVGCDDPNSIARTPDGAWFFSAQAGLCMLDRSFGVQQPGRAIEGRYPTAVSGRYFAGAALTADQHCVRWLQRNGPQAIRFDYFHTKALGAPVWTEDTLQAYSLSWAAASIGAACAYQGRLVFIDIYGTLYREKLPTDTNPWLDSRTGSTAWVDATRTLATEKAGGTPQALHRLRRVKVEGQCSSTPGALAVTITSDVATLTRSWTYAELSPLVASERLRVEVHNNAQKVTRASVSIVETDPGASNRGTGRGLVLRDVGLEVAPLAGGARNATAARK